MTEQNFPGDARGQLESAEAATRAAQIPNVSGADNRDMRRRAAATEPHGNSDAQGQRSPVRLDSTWDPATGTTPDAGAARPALSVASTGRENVDSSEPHKLAPPGSTPGPAPNFGRVAAVSAAGGCASAPLVPPATVSCGDSSCLSRACPDCDGGGWIAETAFPYFVPEDLEERFTRRRKCPRCFGVGAIPDDAEEAFTDEYRRQIAGLPHGRQTAVLSGTDSQTACDLAAKTITILAERGIPVA